MGGRNILLQDFSYIIEDAYGGSSPHPLEAAKSAVHLIAEFVVCIESFHIASSVCALLRFLCVGWECVPRWSSEGASRPLKAIAGPVGWETSKKAVFPQKSRLIWTPVCNHFQSLDAIKNALKFQCVPGGSFSRLWTRLESQRDPKGCEGESF